MSEEEESKQPTRNIVQIGDVAVGSDESSLNEIIASALTLVKNRSVKSYVTKVRKNRMIGIG